MSSLLLDVAEPLLEDLELPRDEDLYVFSLKLGASLWNAHVVRDAGKRARMIQQVKAEMRRIVPADVYIPFDEVLERARTRYPDETRTIKDVELGIDSDGDTEVLVYSSAPPGYRPDPALAPPAPKPRTPAVDEGKVPAAMRARYEEVTALTDAVCTEHLNAEYAALARKAAAALSRKRPSPIAQGRANGWACGIVNALGRVNFLADKSQTPHMPVRQLCDLFGVSMATGAAKAREVEKALRMHPFAPEWSTASTIRQNPFAWMVEIDGIVADARHLPPEVQQRLVEMGIVPPLPSESD